MFRKVPFDISRGWKSLSASAHQNAGYLLPWQCALGGNPRCPSPRSVPPPDKYRRSGIVHARITADAALALGVPCVGGARRALVRGWDKRLFQTNFSFTFCLPAASTASAACLKQTAKPSRLQMIRCRNQFCVDPEFVMSQSTGIFPFNLFGTPIFEMITGIIYPRSRYCLHFWLIKYCYLNTSLTLLRVYTHFTIINQPCFCVSPTPGMSFKYIKIISLTKSKYSTDRTLKCEISYGDYYLRINPMLILMELLLLELHP